MWIMCINDVHVYTCIYLLKKGTYIIKHKIFTTQKDMYVIVTYMDGQFVLVVM